MEKRALFLLILILCMSPVFNQELQFEWSKTLGTSGNNRGKSIICDNDGYLYVAGEFKENFILDDSTISGFGQNNIFVIKLDWRGNLIWAKSFGSNKQASVSQICFDRNMNIVCTGTFAETLFLKDTMINSNGGTDIFILKINSTGKILRIFSDGGAGDEYSNSITIDHDNSIYICGNFSGEAKFGNHTLTSSCEWIYTYFGDSVYTYIENAFYAKYDSTNNCLFAKQICKDRSDLYSIVTDANNNIYATGYFSSYNDLT